MTGQGRLVIIGGAEDRTGDCVILRRFWELCGGESARIAVLGTATSVPTELGGEYVTAFSAMGVEAVEVLALDTRDEANADETLELLRSMTGVFFTGGDQLRIASVIGGSKVDLWLHEAYKSEGLVIGGTSAGAAMMSSTMVLGGSDTVPTTSTVRLGPGLGFVTGFVIDMHFAERRRLSRLLAAIARFPHDLGVGIDEDTALVVEGETFEVLGSGAVSIIDVGAARSIVLPEDDGPIALTGALIHVLPAGYTFDLRTRTPVITDTPQS